jgi:GNAT superfamily N-acetyltransferase
MGTICVKSCTADDILGAPNLSELLEEYGAESSIEAIGTVNHQPAIYKTLEASGALSTIGAFDGDRLIGFVAMLTNALPHYGKLVSVIESFFVTASERGTGIGLKLLREAEEIAVNRGAAGIIVSAPVGGRLAEVLERHKPYTETNRVFFRGLK